MDLSPPSLTQSPSSPSNTYCSSERSSLDYPSPGLVEQHYKLSPIYGAEPPCSLPASLDPETSSLPPLDAMSQPTEWGPTVIHPVSSAATMPSIVSAEYEAFNSYPYAHDVYQSHAHAHAHAHAHSHGHSHAHAHGHSAHASPVAASTPPPGGPSSRSPILAGPRTPLSYPTSAPGPMTPRVKLETGPDFGQAMDVSHYPSPRSVQSVSSVPTTYAGDNGAYTTSTTPGYMSDDGSSSWQKPNYQPVEPEQFYAAPTSHSSAFMQDARRAYRVTRPRRAPRRLTTKEEANFQCEVKGCGKLFSRSYNFKAHMETHDEKREYPFPCNVADCNKKFVRKTDLQRHHSSVHAKERNHKCDYCSRMFARKDTLRRHMEDGCSKRFDIGTLDLRADAYDSLNPSARAMTGPMGHLVPPPGGLPPMAIPPLGSSSGSSSILTSIPPSMRARDLVAGPDHTTGHWGR